MGESEHEAPGYMAVKRRADVVGIFANERAIVRLIGAVRLRAER
jgi:hypothetical protein